MATIGCALRHAFKCCRTELRILPTVGIHFAMIYLGKRTRTHTTNSTAEWSRASAKPINMFTLAKWQCSGAKFTPIKHAVRACLGACVVCLACMQRRGSHRLCIRRIAPPHPIDFNGIESALAASTPPGTAFASHTYKCLHYIYTCMLMRMHVCVSF